MPRRPTKPSAKTADTVEKHVVPGLRSRLEAARLDLLALFRALDSLLLAQHPPPPLRAILELDADCAEALVVLDRSPQGLNLAAMTRDTLASLDDIPRARQHFLDTLPTADRERLGPRIQLVRITLDPLEAYHQIPGKDPRLR